MAIFKWPRRREDQATGLPFRGDTGTPSLPVTRNLPRFQSSGRDLGLGDSLSPTARARLRDAFTPTQPVHDPAMFAGREEVLQTLIRSIEDLRLHVVVYGDRGIGKTSLLHLLTRLAREAHYHVAYHSCGERDNFSETFRTIATQIPLLYDARYDPTDDETASGATLASRLPEGNYSVNQLSEVFSHLSNTRLIIILDEFDRGPEGDFRRSIAEFIKNVSDRSLRVQLVIGGVGTSLAELVEHIPSIRRNIVGLGVPAMTPDEVAEVISIGQKISGVTYSASAIEQVVRVANGSPYLASMLAQYAGFRAVDTGSASVTTQQVLEAAKQIATELRGRLSSHAVEAVDAALAEGMQSVLTPAAAAAMSAMGRVHAGDGIDGEQLARCAERFPRLLEAEPGEAEGRYRFVEEGLPVYLWMTLKRG